MRFLILALIALLPCAFAASWTTLSFTQSVIATVAAPDASTVIIGGGDNGVGANVLKSTDGGNTFNSLNVSNGNAFFMGAAFSSATAGIVTGLAVGNGADQYTTDGENFQRSTETPVIYLEACQNAEVGGSASSYGVVGNIGSANGVGYSTNGGVSFRVSDINSTSGARYGSYPTDTTWYIAAGNFPNTSNIQMSYHVEFDELNRASLFNNRNRRRVLDDGWSGEIKKTTDGGATWTSQFSTQSFYFNQIACVSETLCWAVGENDNAAYVYGTFDGTTWQLLQTYAGASLMTIAALDDSTVWIGGGIQTNSGFTGLFGISTDSGKTFTQQNLPGMYFNDFAVVNTELAYATAFNDLQQSNILKYA